LRSGKTFRVRGSWNWRADPVGPGDNAIRIHDEVTNHGFDSMPHMMLYHINLGWPIVSADSTLITSGDPAEVTPRDAVAAPGLEQCYSFEEPRASYPEQVFYHALQPDEDGYCQAGLINHNLLASASGSPGPRTRCRIWCNGSR